MGEAATPLDDPTIYSCSDDIGETTFEVLIRLLLIPLIKRWLSSQGRLMFVSGNQFIYWVKHEPTRNLAPDVYGSRGLPPDAEPDCLKLWEHGPDAVPCFAIEIVSEGKAKDYATAPLRHDELGVDELIIYDARYKKRRQSASGKGFREIDDERRGAVRFVNSSKMWRQVVVLQVFVGRVGKIACNLA